MQFAIDLTVRHAGRFGTGSYDVAHEMCIPEREGPT